MCPPAAPGGPAVKATPLTQRPGAGPGQSRADSLRPRIPHGLPAPFRGEHLDPRAGGLRHQDPCFPAGAVDGALDGRPGSAASSAFGPVTRRAAPSRDSAPLSRLPLASRWLPPSTGLPRVTNRNAPHTSERGWQPLGSHWGHLTRPCLLWGPARSGKRHTAFCPSVCLSA